MIKVSIKVKIHPGKKKEFMHALMGFRSVQGLIDQLRKEKGCLKYHLHKDKDQKDRFIIESEWHTLEEFEKHFRSKCYSILLGAIHVLCNSPEVEITNESRILGMEAIEKARKEESKS